MKAIPTLFVVLGVILTGFATLSLDSVGARAKPISFIRDAEIENIIRGYAAPLFKAAGLEPSSLKIYLVKDNSLNAFVMGGQKIFINTGLLMRSTRPGQVIGVIAHETGHIAGGHLSRIEDVMKKSTAQTIMAFVLGGAAMLSGRGDVGSAIIMGGQQIGARTFLQYSRTQESSADQAAMTLLDKTKQSSRGLLEFMQLLAKQERLSAYRQDPYMRTHPLSRDRINAILAHMKQSPYTEKSATPEALEKHRRIKAKLQAFINPIKRTLNQYKASDTRIEARYARSIAFYRRHDLSKALPLIDGLIAERPGDPYFQELKGQMLFENGRAAEGLPYYERAVAILPSSALLRSELAQIQLEMDDPSLLDMAILNLNSALRTDGDSPFTWRQLAIAQGRKGDMGESALALAEEAILTEKKSVARYQASKAERLLPRGSRGWLKAQDILEVAGKKDK